MTRRHRLPARRSPARLRPVMRKEPLDFIGIDYSIGNRGAEQAIIPLVLDRKIGVVAYFPFDAGGLFQRAGATPLPAWAADFDAKTWGQFFVKYAISQPAVTVVRTGTSQAKHMLDNIGGGRSHHLSPRRLRAAGTVTGLILAEGQLKSPATRIR